MTCYHPASVRIRRKAAYGQARLSYTQVVPCGSCTGCRGDQARGWAVRMMHESQMHHCSWFLTLTYKDEEVPDNGSLNPEHFRVFIKELRRAEIREAKELGREIRPISYYGCGEYGGKTRRPHYHAMLFGKEFLDRIRHPQRHRDHVWWSPRLEELWGRGFAEIGTVTMASAAYVAGYIRKKITKRQDPEAYERVVPETGEVVKIEREFARMSLNPALGSRWLEKYWTDVYPRDFVVVDGKEMKPPRYYDKWMDKEHPEIMMEVRDKRYEEMEDLSVYTLRAKEKIHEARSRLYEQRDTV